MREMVPAGLGAIDLFTAHHKISKCFHFQECFDNIDAHYGLDAVEKPTYRKVDKDKPCSLCVESNEKFCTQIKVQRWCQVFWVNTVNTTN